MRQEQQRQIDSLRRVQDFIRTHAEALSTLDTAPGRKQLDAAVATIAMHGTTQGAADRSMAAQISRQRALAKELVRSHMVPIAKFARAKLRGTPDFAALTRQVSDKRVAPLVRAARSMAAAAQPYADALASGGFPADTIAQLAAVTDALSDAIAQRGHLRFVRVGSTTGLAQDIALGREAVKLLDAVISRQFAADATFLAAWASASRVDLKPGSARAVAAPLPVLPPTVAQADVEVKV